MRMKKLVFTVGIALAVISFSCTDELEMQKSRYGEEQPARWTPQKDDNLSLKKDFGQALAKVLAESKEARALIKEEALKKLDYDYDVLYSLVKDKKLEDDKTLKAHLTNYIPSDKLDLIETKLPTLTLFVPTLPENSFSAELWDPEKDVPVVGIRTKETNDVPLFDSTGKESVITAPYIPGYPVVVVKENERIILQKNITRSLISASLLEGTELAFVDDVFDNFHSDSFSATKKARGSNIIPNTRPEAIKDKLKKIYEAFDVYEGTDGWQRDYVYYNISPANDKGPFLLNYKECLCSFQLLGDPMTAYKKISDQTGDPTINPDYYFNPRGAHPENPWTDGEFEFKVKVHIGASSPVGSEIVTYFRMAAGALFGQSYRQEKHSYVLNKLIANKVLLTLPLFEWNLENYSAFVKIGIEEGDSPETVRNLETTTSEFATNFEFNVGLGEKVKVGGKFGASAKEVRTVTYEVTTTNGNDDLGEVIVNFGDKIIVSRGILTEHVARDGTVSYNREEDFNNKYYNGWYKIEIAPLQMY